MRRKTKIITLTTLVFAGSATLLYAAGHGSDRSDHRPSFEELDANADKMISKEEIASHARGRFDASDTNNDGLLSAEELKARHSAQAAKMAQARHAKMLAKLDADNDGLLSFEEMQAGRRGPSPERRFEHLDEDKDGMISEEEFTSAKDHGHKRKKKNK